MDRFNMLREDVSRENMTWEGVFSEIKEKYEREEISLLLGNGFTQAVVEAYCEENVFNQKKIVEEILSQQRDEWKIFEPLKEKKEKEKKDIKTVEELFVAVKTQLKNCFLGYLFKANEKISRNFSANFSNEI